MSVTMSESLHLEELNLLLDSPVCMTCDHRQVLHWDTDDDRAGCHVCGCPGFVQEGDVCSWFPDVAGDDAPRANKRVLPASEGLPLVLGESTR